MTFNAVVTGFEDIAPTIRVLNIQVQNEIYDFHAGQYTILSQDGFEPRHFSMANAPHVDGILEFHIRNFGRGLSQHLCENIKKGDSLQLSPPQGQLKIKTTNHPIVMIAGGTGISPFLSMLDAYPDLDATLYWGAESAQDFYIDPTREGVVVHQSTQMYPVDVYIQNGVQDYDTYLAGPPRMVIDSKAKLLAAGVNPDRIITDEF